MANLGVIVAFDFIRKRGNASLLEVQVRNANFGRLIGKPDEFLEREAIRGI